jgi:ABC-type antimicrobial peptide transport system permease subunit
VEFQLYTGGKSQPFFYIPYAQHFNQNSLMTFQLKSGRNLNSIRFIVEKIIHGIAPQLPIFQIQTMHEALYTLNGLLLLQIGAVLAAIMGGLGLILAVVGLYGVLSYTVGRRVHEIGIRMALGASRGAVFHMIYQQAFVIIGAGLGLGLAIALLAARAVGSFVIVSVWEPMTYLCISMALSLAALFACYFPARRAMVMEPTAALREN